MCNAYLYMYCCKHQFHYQHLKTPRMEFLKSLQSIFLLKLRHKCHSKEIKWYLNLSKSSNSFSEVRRLKCLLLKGFTMYLLESFNKSIWLKSFKLERKLQTLKTLKKLRISLEVWRSLFTFKCNLEWLYSNLLVLKFAFRYRII